MTTATGKRIRIYSYLYLFCIPFVLGFIFFSPLVLADDPLGANTRGNAVFFPKPEIIIHRKNKLTALNSMGGLVYQADLPDFKQGDALAVGNVDGDRAQELVWASHTDNMIYVLDMEDIWNRRFIPQSSIEFPHPSRRCMGDIFSCQYSWYNNSDPDSYPLLAVADVDGDGLDEILFGQMYGEWSISPFSPLPGQVRKHYIVGGVEGTAIHVYAGNGSKQGELPLTYKNKGDRLAAGDVNGDGRAEVIYADRADKLFVYSTNSDKTSVIPDVLFEGMDGIAVGDLNQDGVDEIVVASSKLNTFLYYSGDGEVMGQSPEHIDDWPVRIDQWDGLSIGDVDHDASNEIIFGDRRENKIRVFMFDSDTLGQSSGAELSGMTHSHTINSTFDRKDQLVLGDINSDSVIVGAPGDPKVVRVDNQTIAIIHAPPKYEDNCKLNKYYAEFSSEEAETTSLTAKSLSSVVATSELKTELGIAVINATFKYMQKSVNRITQESSEEVKVSVGRTTRASLYDQAITVSTIFDVWEYPVIEPKHLAVKNGEQQFVAVQIPKGPPTPRSFNLNDSEPRCNVFSYPQSYQELVGYKKASEAYVPQGFDVGPEKRDIWFKQKVQNKKKTIHDSFLEVGWSAEGNIGTGKLSKDFGINFSTKMEGKYGTQNIRTHLLTVEDNQGINIKWTGMTDAEMREVDWTSGQLYAVDHVLYYRADGALILDYVITDIGDDIVKAHFKIKRPSYSTTREVDKRIGTILKAHKGGSELAAALGMPIIAAKNSAVRSGNTFKVPVSIVSASNLRKVDVNVSYDHTILKAINMELDTLASGAEMNRAFLDGQVQFEIEKTDGISGEGPLASIEFELVGTDGELAKLGLDASAIDLGTGKEVDLGIMNSIFIVLPDVRRDPTIIQSGSIPKIPDGSSFDLDNGWLVRGQEGDVGWEPGPRGQLYIVPKNGAAMAKVNNVDVNFEGCATVDLTTSKISVRALSAGSQFCVLTNKGRYSQLLVESAVGSTDKNIRLRYSTWEGANLR